MFLKHELFVFFRFLAILLHFFRPFPRQAAVDSPEDEGCAAAEDADTDEDVDVNDHACVSNGAVTASGSGGSGSGSTPQQSIASQLDALAAQEDLLLQQFRADMRHLDEVRREWRARTGGGRARFQGG